MLHEVALAAVGATLAAFGAAIASFFSDETTAEGCETVGELLCQRQSCNQVEKALPLLLSDAAKAVPSGSRLWRKTVERKEEKGFVVAGGLTKLPSIRGFSFASRRPAGVGLADIASN